MNPEQITPEERSEYRDHIRELLEALKNENLRPEALLEAFTDWFLAERYVGYRAGWIDGNNALCAEGESRPGVTECFVKPHKKE